jgi:hypothetical protein
MLHIGGVLCHALRLFCCLLLIASDSTPPPLLLPLLLLLVLLQVNPLAEDESGNLIAADAKLGFDDSASYRCAVGHVL